MSSSVKSASPIADAPIRGSVLVVDDEAQLRQTTTTFLTRRGYDVRAAGSALEALTHLRSIRFDAMICDVRMPESSGLDLLPRALQIDPDLAIVMLSGVNDAGTANAALQMGASEYVVKPAPLAELELVLQRAMQRREQSMQRRRANRARKVELSLRTTELEGERRRIREMTIDMVEALINAMEAKDMYLRGRSQRIADLAASIAENLGLDADIVEDVRLAGRLHDVGMIGIREPVLNKPGALLPEEFEHVKEHVRIGIEILTPLRHLGPALTYIQDHHERWDGTGYPRGLTGNEISIGGQILAAADAMDALTSRRAFRSATTPEDALKTIGYVVGKLIDDRIYDALCDVVRRQDVLIFVDEAGSSDGA